MKKKIVLVLSIFLVGVFLLTACGGTSLKEMQQKFKDNDYSIKTMPNADLDKVAGAEDGFYARLGKPWDEEISDFPPSDVKVYVYKFKNKELAKEFADNTSQNCAVSLNEEFVCRVWHYIYDGNERSTDTNSAETKAAIDIFNSFF